MEQRRIQQNIQQNGVMFLEGREVNHEVIILKRKLRYLLDGSMQGKYLDVESEYIITISGKDTIRLCLLMGLCQIPCLHVNHLRDIGYTTKNQSFDTGHRMSDYIIQHMAVINKEIHFRFLCSSVGFPDPVT